MKNLSRWFALLLIAVMIAAPTALYAAEEAPEDPAATETTEDNNVTQGLSLAIILAGGAALTGVGLAWIGYDRMNQPQEEQTD